MNYHFPALNKSLPKIRCRHFDNFPSSFPHPKLLLINDCHRAILIIYFEQVLFYVNNRQIISEAEKSDWAGNVKERANFQLGGFTGNIDELSIGACFHDESWTLTTYLNQHPENRWPSLSAR